MDINWVWKFPNPLINKRESDNFAKSLPINLAGIEELGCSNIFHIFFIQSPHWVDGKTLIVISHI